MNRRSFLKGGVAAAVAVAIGRSFVEPVEAEQLVKLPAMGPYFTSKDAWYIKTAPPEGMMMFKRERVEIDGDFSTGELRYKARERYSVADEWAKPRDFACDCAPGEWMASCHRYRPDIAARLCHNCGGYITDERRENWSGLKRLPSRDLSEASLEELLVEIRKHIADGKALTLMPTHAIYGSSG